MERPLAERLAEHVDRLAREHGVEIIHRGAGIAYRRERRITIAPVRGRFSYLVALHELAHVVGPQSRLRLSQEIEAWEWALAHAIVDPTPANYRSILRCLDAYGKRQQRWASMKRPPEFDPFVARLRALAG